MVSLLSKSINFSRALKIKKIPILPKFIRMVNRVIYACDIPPEADIHKTVTFAHHGLGVVINPNVVIGKNTKLLHNVTLGGNGKKRKYEGKIIVAPFVGENVLIGAGSQIIGPILIGDNAIIGAGSVVTKDVGVNQVVAGVPAKFINKVEIKQ